jgi:putative transposase
VGVEGWLSVSEVADLIGVSSRTVRHRASVGAYLVRQIIGTWNKSGKQYLIALSSLPPDAQRRWLTRAVPVPPSLEPSPETAAAAALDFIKIQDRHGDDALAQSVNRGGVAREALSLEGPERTGYIRKTATDLGVSERSVRRWMDVFQKEGAVVDRTKTREGAGNGRRRLPPEAIRFIEGLFLRLNQPTVMSCLRTYTEVAPTMGWPTVSRATFFRVIDAIPPTVVRMGREGEQRWRNTDMPKAKRTREGVLRNEEWALDHKQLDFWCNYNGRAIRPWVSATVDWATGCLVGAAFAVKPNSESIAASFRSAVYPKEGLPFHGLPARVYMDNGKDYRSVRLSGQEEKFKVEVGPAVQGWLQLCHIDSHYAIGRSPWAKAVIERAFKDLNEFSREQVSFCGESTKKRPEYMVPTYVKKLLAADKLRHFEDLAGMLNEWYKRTYLVWPSEAFDGKSRLEVYNSLPAVRNDMPSKEVSFLLFGKGCLAKVYSTGIKKFGKDFWFWADEMTPYIGKTVMIRYDTGKIGEIYVWDHGKFICKVQNRELMRIHATEEDVKAWMKDQARARKHIREEVIARRKTVEDIVAERAIAGPAVLTLPVLDSPVSKVTTLTGLEKAAKARTSQGGGQADPAIAKSRDLGKQYLRALGERALAEIDRRRAQ